MSILATDLVLWSSANIPTDEVSTAGGAISTTARPTLVQLTATSTVDYVSSAADTRTVTTTGRDATGSIVTETKTLNGTTTVTGTQSFERVLSVVLSATNGSNTVTVTQHSNSATIATIGPNETTRHIAFQQSFSSTSIKNYYEKHFWKNNNGSLTLTVAAVKLTADPSAVITIGCATALNDSGTVTNRLTAPAGVTFVDDNISQSVPTGQIAAGSAIGLWIDMTLAANNAALKSSFTTQLSGQTT